MDSIEPQNIENIDKGSSPLMPMWGMCRGGVEGERKEMKTFEIFL
jgi:hypothetical protein